ncbi:CHY zinc finger protein [Oceanobacillus salinisoli]|uniref:CHY zinc finger protein n=1 Tax=Oceanobacillus salinisoli TaxID=2678611 RepID=UPI0012E146A7|nr:CHY zinc finger protein [Oceanobacillus salinisoli]
METRCKHYHQNIDRIAIKFYCCGEYFPCITCHNEYGCGNRQVWPRSKFDEKAILCGACGNELTISEYLESGSTCPACQAGFNPGCRMHYHFYFEM